MRGSWKRWRCRVSDEPQMLGIGLVEQQQQIFKDLVGELAATLGITYAELKADYDRTAYSCAAEFIKIQMEWAEESLKRKYPRLQIDTRLDGLT